MFVDLKLHFRVIGTKTPYELYLLAANQGVGIAQFYIGFAYDNGTGYKKDIEKAKYWYKRSTNQGEKKQKKILII